MIWSLIRGNLAEIIAGLAVIVGAVWLRLSGRKAERQADKIKDLTAFKETTERMQDAPAPVDGDASRQRMRDRPRDQR